MYGTAGKVTVSRTQPFMAVGKKLSNPISQFVRFMFPLECAARFQFSMGFSRVPHSTAAAVYETTEMAKVATLNALDNYAPFPPSLCRLLCLCTVYYDQRLCCILVVSNHKWARMFTKHSYLLSRWSFCLIAWTGLDVVSPCRH
jgi:hypothetical protein